MWHAAEMFFTGTLPIFLVANCRALTGPNPVERRACLIGVAIAVVVLIPLARLVF